MLAKFTTKDLVRSNSVFFSLYFLLYCPQFYQLLACLPKPPTPPKQPRLRRLDQRRQAQIEHERTQKSTTNGVTTTYTHDNNGSTTRKQSPTETVDYTYNQEKQLIQVTSTLSGTMRYWYAPDGIRVTSQVNGVNTFYVIDRNNLTGFAQVIGEMDQAGGATVLYTFGDDLISQTRTTGVRFYHYDGQMSTRLLTDGAGNITDTYSYYAFGELLAKTGATENNYLYTGEQYDPNVGFYYLRARYYNPAIGRFLTVDPVVGSIFEPQTLHKYVYVGNDPVNKLDPSGQFTLLGAIAIGVMLAILIGVGIYALFALRKAEVEIRVQRPIDARHAIRVLLLEMNVVGGIEQLELQPGYIATKLLIATIGFGNTISEIASARNDLIPQEIIINPKQEKRIENKYILAAVLYAEGQHFMRKDFTGDFYDDYKDYNILNSALDIVVEELIKRYGDSIPDPDKTWLRKNLWHQKGRL